MGETRAKIYEALIDGATDGLSGQELYDYVHREVPKTSSKRLVRAALLALSDPDVTDKHVLDVIYALAIKHRLDSLNTRKDAHDDDDDQSESIQPAPLLKNSRKELRGGTAGVTMTRTNNNFTLSSVSNQPT